MGQQVEISSLEDRHSPDNAGLVSVTNVDTAAEFAQEAEKELDPAEALRVRCVATD